MNEEIWYWTCMECVSSKTICEKCGKCGREFEDTGCCANIQVYPPVPKRSTVS